MAQNLPNSVTEIKPEIQEAQRSQDKYKDLSYPIYAYDIQTAQKTHKEKIFKGAKQIIQAILNLKLHKQYHKKKKRQVMERIFTNYVSDKIFVFGICILCSSTIKRQITQIKHEENICIDIFPRKIYK